MTQTVYTSLRNLKQTRYDRLLVQIQAKVAEIDGVVQKKDRLEQELENLIELFPKRKRQIDKELLTGKVNREVFEEIGYRVMSLEHEISAHRLKIKAQEELIEKLRKELAELNLARVALTKVLEKYDILIELDQKEQKRVREHIEDKELEEFAKSMTQP